jgi:hypothetical protein
MTTDDSLLLSDLDRIAGDIGAALNLDEYEDYEHPDERLKITACDLTQALTRLRRASREMVDFRERLERRLKA